MSAPENVHTRSEMTDFNHVTHNKLSLSTWNFPAANEKKMVSHSLQSFEANVALVSDT